MALNSKNKSAKTDVSSLILGGVLDVVRSEGEWIGTMTDLSSALTKVLGRSAKKQLPQSPSALRTALNKIVNRLRNRSVSVKFRRSNGTRLLQLVTR